MLCRIIHLLKQQGPNSGIQYSTSVHFQNPNIFSIQYSVFFQNLLFGQTLIVISWRSSEHPLLTCGHVEGPGVHQQFAVPLLGVDLGQLREPDVIADAQAHLAPGGRERGELVTGAQGVRLLEGHLAGDILRGRVSTGLWCGHYKPMSNR